MPNVLKKNVRKLKRWARRIPYRHLEEFSVTIQETPVQFSIKDKHAKKRFYHEYAEGHIYEEEVLTLLLKHVSGKQSFIDVGANLGWFSCILGKLQPQLEIHSFEMDVLNFAELEKNTALNNLMQVHLHMKAVADKAGLLKYHRKTKKPRADFALSTHPEEIPGHKLMEVEAIALDDFFDEQGITPDVIKIDIEGAEALALKGLQRTLSKTKPTLFLEVHPHNFQIFDTSMEEIFGYLFAAGYRLQEIPEDGDPQNPVLKEISSPDQIDYNGILLAT